MRVLVNETTALRQRAGIGQYTAGLLSELRAQAQGDVVATYPGPLARAGVAAWKKAGTLLGHASDAGSDSTWTAWSHNWGRRLASYHFRALSAARAFDVYHEPNSIPMPCDRPTVATVHDLSVLLHPEWHPVDRVRYYEKHFAAGLERCAHVLAVSEFTRREIMQHFHVPGNRITVTHNGIRAGLRPMTEAEMLAQRRRLGLPKTFLLHVGTLEPRKNLLMLMKAYVSLPRPLRERCPLVLAGSWGWNIEGLARFYTEVGRHEGVVHIGYVGDADLPAMYNLARALVFPSHYEGFGFPPVEMMACGGPVLASTAGAVVETVGGGAHLLDPKDEDGWRTAMLRVITDDDWHGALSLRAEEMAKPFSWRRCAALTWRVYRDAAGAHLNHAQAA